MNLSIFHCKNLLLLFLFINLGLKFILKGIELSNVPLFRYLIKFYFKILFYY